MLLALNARTTRPSDTGVIVSRTVLATVRILIASYFLALATGLVFEPAAKTLFDPMLPQNQAQIASTAFLFVTAFAIMVGAMVRLAALLLAVYLFWSGFLHYDLTDPTALSAFWREMALLGAVLMIAVTEQGSGTQVRIWRKKIAPRRVSQETAQRLNETVIERRRRTERERSQQGVFTGLARDSGDIDIYELGLKEGEKDIADDSDNIFADDSESGVHFQVPMFKHR